MQNKSATLCYLNSAEKGWQKLKKFVVHVNKIHYKRIKNLNIASEGQ